MKLVGPLRELFKGEVRALGKELGLPEQFIGRHPRATRSHLGRRYGRRLASYRQGFLAAVTPHHQ
jgi:hypothetical protein